MLYRVYELAIIVHGQTYATGGNAHYLFHFTADRLPYSIRVLLESAVRNCDEFQVRPTDVNNILEWEQNQEKSVEIPFHPARVILQDFT